MEDTQKKLDKALKRNLGEVHHNLLTVAPKTTPAELPTEEPIGDNDDTDPIEE